MSSRASTAPSRSSQRCPPNSKGSTGTSTSRRRPSPEESPSFPTLKMSVRCATASRLAPDQLDPVAVRIADERDHRPLGAAPGPVRRLLGLDAVGGQLLERLVQVVDQDRYVVVARAEVVRVDAVVVGQLEHGILVRQPHEHVHGLRPDVHPATLLESELLVEGDGPVDVADAVAGVKVARHASNLPVSAVTLAARQALVELVVVPGA